VHFPFDTFQPLAAFNLLSGFGRGYGVGLGVGGGGVVVVV
jgi:hypothetical protein